MIYVRRLTTVLAAVSCAAWAAQKPVDFQREVRSILSDKCFQCHGPDKTTRMANLRLDTREGLLELRRGKRVVSAGNAAASLLWQRVSAADPLTRMPPVHINKTISEEQKATLKRWIDEGAKWSAHWAFTAPRRPAPPVVKAKDWVRNPVDAFILANLERAGLAPAPEADRRTLIRRVTLDLTGLPPEPADVAAFVADKDPKAYEKVVDRLLTSPHWGEHRAHYWLDAARYADTHGIHIDNYREMWAYRDWVIDAYNRNLPFDRFTIEQLAGDLLPNPTLEQRIATGFQRCAPSTNEAGAIRDEYEAIYAKDRVDTTSAVWLGLTVGCATCHDHKYDPILQRDFYSMTAFFRNTTQFTFDGNVSEVNPVVLVPRAEDRGQYDKLVSLQQSLRDRMRQAEKAEDPEFRKWMASGEWKGNVDPMPAGREILSLTAGSGTLPDGVKVVPDPAMNGGSVLELGKKVVALDAPEWNSTQAFSVSAWIKLANTGEGVSVAGQMDSAKKPQGWSLTVGGGRVPSFQIQRPDQRMSYSGTFINILDSDRWYHIAATYDGSGAPRGMALYLDGELVPRAGSTEDLREIRPELRSTQPLRISGFNGGALAEMRMYRGVLSPSELALLANWGPADKRASEKTARLYHSIHHNHAWQEAWTELAALDPKMLALRKRGAMTFVMQENGASKPVARVLFRGMYDQPKDTVEPAVPVVLPQLSAKMPRNRLGLAQWLVDASNPLTARVTVNRFWQELFGAGLVRTAEDFGSQGEAPSHPELLDWLAVEFRESGWDMKKFYRTLVMSAAYRQSAAASPEKLKADPENRLISRGPRFRMDAEMVRDYALAASGLLATKIGGPSVKPYQPDGVWEAVAMFSSNTRFYKHDSGDNLYRRSLYTFWKRSAPPASMDLFNAPSRENCTVRRERTNTPLQALVTMNDPQFVEAARHLAELALKPGGAKGEARFDFMAERLMGRDLAAREREVVGASYKDFLAYYDAKPEDARKLISTGESKPDPSLPAVELAAMTVVANQLMNLDEVLTK
jgi:hypothetical protein